MSVSREGNGEGEREERGWEGAAEEQHSRDRQRDRVLCSALLCSVLLCLLFSPPQHHLNGDIPLLPPPTPISPISISTHSISNLHIHGPPGRIAPPWMDGWIDGWMESRDGTEQNRGGPVPSTPPGVAVYDLPRSDISHDRLDPRTMLPASRERNLAKQTNYKYPPPENGRSDSWSRWISN